MHEGLLILALFTFGVVVGIMPTFETWKANILWAISSGVMVSVLFVLIALK